jgi:hypothetical protein
MTGSPEEPAEKKAITFPELTGQKKELFAKIQAQIKKSITFADVLPEIEELMLNFLQAQRLTIYQNARNGQEIVSKFITGHELFEIRLGVNANSMAGYVAVSGKELLIDDVHDSNALKAIHKTLKFDSSYDRRSGFNSKSMMIVPIRNKAPLLGVIQIINKIGGNSFSAEDLKFASHLAAVIGEKFHEEFEGTNDPYEYLVSKKMITWEKLDSFKKRVKKEGVSMTYLMVSELKIPPEVVAASLESYYQVPFMRYDPKIVPPKALLKKLNIRVLKQSLKIE